MSTAELILAGGLVASLLGHIVTYLRDRSSVRVDSISAEAAADLTRAQASSEVLTFMREDYNRMRTLYDSALGEMATLRAEVGALRDTVTQFEAVVMTLPDEYRGRFAEVLRKGKAPKVSQSPG